MAALNRSRSVGPNRRVAFEKTVGGLRYNHGTTGELGYDRTAGNWGYDRTTGELGNTDQIYYPRDHGSHPRDVQKLSSAFISPDKLKGAVRSYGTNVSFQNPAIQMHPMSGHATSVSPSKIDAKAQIFSVLPQKERVPLKMQTICSPTKDKETNEQRVSAFPAAKISPKLSPSQRPSSQPGRQTRTSSEPVPQSRQQRQGLHGSAGTWQKPMQMLHRIHHMGVFDRPKFRSWRCRPKSTNFHRKPTVYIANELKLKHQKKKIDPEFADVIYEIRIPFPLDGVIARQMESLSSFTVETFTKNGQRVVQEVAHGGVDRFPRSLSQQYLAMGNTTYEGGLWNGRSGLSMSPKELVDELHKRLVPEGESHDPDQVKRKPRSKVHVYSTVTKTGDTRLLRNTDKPTLASTHASSFQTKHTKSMHKWEPYITLGWFQVDNWKEENEMLFAVRSQLENFSDMEDRKALWQLNKTPCILTQDDVDNSWHKPIRTMTDLREHQRKIEESRFPRKNYGEEVPFDKQNFFRISTEIAKGIEDNINREDEGEDTARYRLNVDPAPLTDKYLQTIGKMKGVKLVESRNLVCEVSFPIVALGGSKQDVRMVHYWNNAVQVLKREVACKDLPDNFLEIWELNGREFGQ